MVKCEVCERENKSLVGLTTHLNRTKNKDNHPNSLQEYYDIYLKKDNEGICQNPNCPNDHPKTSFQGLGHGYSVGCCGSCSQLFPAVRAKIVNTCLENRGVTHHLKTKECMDKQRQTVQERYGEGGNIQQVKAIKEKTRKTNIKRYGGPSPTCSQDIIKKREENYLIKTNGKYKGPMEERKNQRKLSEQFINLSKDRIIKDLNDRGLEVIEYVKCSSYAKLKCKKCNHEFQSKPNWIFDKRRIHFCMNCAEKIYGTMQKEVYDFCSQYFNNIIENDRKILEGKEIDILIPEINLGIEFNGLYHHNELFGTPNDYHINKTKVAKQKGIKLIHIFEDEWVNKQEIVKSILLAKMGKISNKIGARSCIIQQLDINQAKSFLKLNHLQGYSPAKYLGLIYNNEIVCCLGIGKPRFNKNYEWEIIRFCNKLNTTVMGGMNKLLKYFIINYIPKSIITYADARYGTGASYLKCDFNFVHWSRPNYFYTKNSIRESRMKYQKHKLPKLLENFDSTLTEWENMKENNYGRIWDCGNYVYEWK